MHPQVDRLEPRQLFAVDPLTIVRTLPFDAHIKATYVDITGNKITISMKGPGSGSVQFDTDTTANAVQISVQDTTPKSQVSIKGETTVGSIVITGSLKSFSGSKLDLVTGTFTATESVKTISVRSLSDETITLGTGDELSLSARDLFDTGLTVPAGIKSLKVNTWSDSDDVKDTITTSELKSLSSKGAFAAAVNADSIGKVSIGGDLTGDIRSAGDISSISAASYTNVSVFAGITPGFTGLPAAATDISDPAAVIKSFSVKGKFASAFSGSNLAAPLIKKASLNAVLTVNSSVAVGVFADEIDSISGAYDQSQKFKFKKLTDPSQTVIKNDFTLRII